MYEGQQFGWQVFEILVLDQAIICRKIPRFNRGPRKRALKEQNKRLSYYGEGCPNIEILRGQTFVNYCSL
jgi:hypothetical protein